MASATHRVQVARERWNEGLRALGFALWIFPMAQFWMRFFPPLRPFDFHAPAPPASFWLVALACCAAPYAMPGRWFRPLGFETRQLYERLGVRLFRRAAPDGDWVRGRLRTLDAGYALVRNRADLDRHLQEGLPGERSHLAFLVAGFVTMLYSLRLGEAGLAAALFAGNAVFNLYPVLLQRYKRVRLRRRASAMAASPVVNRA